VQAFRQGVKPGPDSRPVLVQENPGPGNPQEGQRMPGPGVWVQEKLRSLVRTTFANSYLRSAINNINIKRECVQMV